MVLKETLQQKQMKLNLLWKSLDEARELKIPSKDLMKIRTTIWNEQDSLAEFVILNKISEKVQYKRKRNVADLEKFYKEEEEDGKENLNQSYF